MEKIKGERRGVMVSVVAYRKKLDGVMGGLACLTRLNPRILAPSIHCHFSNFT